jgi:hypothetical protein
MTAQRTCLVHPRRTARPAAEQVLPRPPPGHRPPLTVPGLPAAQPPQRGHFPRTLIMVPATTCGQNSRTNAVKTNKTTGHRHHRRHQRLAMTTSQTRPSHTPCSASPPAPGADPYDPGLALNGRRALYSLRQWRDSHHLLFDREPARWTSQCAAVTRCQAHQGTRPRALTRPRRSESNWRRRERLARHQSRDR